MSIVGRLLPRELHDTNRPSGTALAVTLMRAVEHRRPEADRIVDDPYAVRFLPPRYRRAVRPLALATPARDLAGRVELGGLSTYVLCRHRFIDEHLRTGLRAGADQVLVLGAGYDSRAYRFADELSGRPVYEVDLAPLSRLKASIVERDGGFPPASVRRVDIDFRTQRLQDRLARSAFVEGLRTVVVWEGVAPYLDSAAVESTLVALRTVCGAGSTLLLDLWDATGGSGVFAPARRWGARAIALIGEPVTFGVSPSAASTMLGRYGFAVTDLAESRTLTTRYATARRHAVESLYVLAGQL